MAPTSLPELPKPSRTPGRSQHLSFRTRIFQTTLEQIIDFLINFFLGGPTGGGFFYRLPYAPAPVAGKLGPFVQHISIAPLRYAGAYV